jgi:hypothetical protein
MEDIKHDLSIETSELERRIQQLERLQGEG